VTFTSVAAQDGWVLESSETSNAGGSLNGTAATASALRVGHDNKDRQYKAVVAFDTSAIPDGATILSVTLRLRRGTLSGTNPFTTHGTGWADVKTGCFSVSTALETGDFQAAATAVQDGEPLQRRRGWGLVGRQPQRRRAGGSQQDGDDAAPRLLRSRRQRRQAQRLHRLLLRRQRDGRQPAAARGDLPVGGRLTPALSVGWIERRAVRKRESVPLLFPLRGRGQRR
jgi:hypothetical protein